MVDSTIWWLMAGAAVAVELVTGTFYLLMLAIGLMAGALAAHAGGSLTVQLVSAAIVSAGAVTGLRAIRARLPPAPPASANRDVNLDVGEVVHIDEWQTDGTATVKYRGAQWTVAATGAGPQTSGAHRVREVVGNRLIVEKI